MIRFCQNIRTRFWVSILQSLSFFHFSWRILWLMYRAITNFFPLTKNYSRRTFHLNWIVFIKSTEKFLEAFEKKFELKKNEFFLLHTLISNLICVLCGREFFLFSGADDFLLADFTKNSSYAPISSLSPWKDFRAWKLGTK